MPPPSHRLPRALLLSVGLHLGLGLWLWTRDEPEPPPAKRLQTPVSLQFVAIDVPPKALPLRPGMGSVTPSRRTPAPRATRPPSTPPVALTTPTTQLLHAHLSDDAG